MSKIPGRIEKSASDKRQVLAMRPKSLTHQHIFSVGRTRLEREKWIEGTPVLGESRPLRILDIGLPSARKGSNTRISASGIRVIVT